MAPIFLVLAKKTRRTLKLLSYLLFFTIIITIGSIYYLLTDAEFSKLKLHSLESKSSSLSKAIDSLTTLRSNLEDDLTEREERLQLVSDRLGDLENILDMKDEKDEKIESRLDTAAIHSSVRVEMLTQIPNGHPVKHGRMSSGYGKRVHPVTGKVKFHRGQDFAVKIGTPVYATADGVVEITRPSNKGSGNYLRLMHGYGFTSSFSHLSKFALRQGTFVKKGDLIGYSGNTGLSSGPHVHYEVRFIGRSLNPKYFIEWNINNFNTIFKNVKGIKWESLVKIIELRVSRQLQLSSQKAVPSKVKSK